MSFIVQAPDLSLNVCSCCLAEAGVKLKNIFAISRLSVCLFVDLLKKYFNKLIYFFASVTNCTIVNLIKLFFLSC